MTNEITTTGIIEEIVETTPGLRSHDIIKLTGMPKQQVFDGLKRLRTQGKIVGELGPSLRSGHRSFKWSTIKK